MINFYRQIELPEYCFLSEAVEFLALGRVLEISWSNEPLPDENGKDMGVDYRFDWREMPDNFEPIHWGYEIFDKAEFELLGIQYPKGYTEASESILFGEICDAQVTSSVSKKFKIVNFPEELRDEVRAKRELANAVLKKSEKVIQLYEETNEKFEVHLEKAWARLFDEIQKKSLEVCALDEAKWQSLADDDRYEDAAKFVKVPPEAVRLGFNFRQNQISFNGTDYVATRVSTDRIVALFISLMASTKPVTSEMFGQTIIVRGAVTVPKPRKGAPHAVDWGRVREHLKAMEHKGGVPGKKEACIQELIDFTRASLGRKVGRTTIQNRLKPELNKIYASKD